MQLSDSDLFLSTPSARRATLFGLRVRVSSTEFLSTPSARRATSLRRISGANRGFLSTPSARRATLEGCVKIVPLLISIHALREEGDPRLDVVVPDPADISIHALREEGDYPCCQSRS